MFTDHTVALSDDLSITLSESGTGRPVLVLHGGGGRATVAPLVAHLAGTARTLTPVHPGWDGTHRPDRLADVGALAETYLHLLRVRGLSDVLLVGSSLGGWIAAEMAVRDTTGAVGGLVLIDAVGVRVEGEPIRDFFALDARGIAEYAWHDPDRGYLDPATLPADRLAARQADMRTLRILAAESGMQDPELLGRLGRVSRPALLIWGASDRIVTPAYGAAYAAAFTDGHLVVIPEAGHLPQLEQPAATFAALDTFLARTGPGTAPGV
ncbi:alpha/beta fold hydrolase [Kitasatospora sp. MBT63]|uniref:alpha/beta fold hydrolase n=1 Tax=Kitasatospora sp. MBT63 TaxID=1444768 RepID=UPI0009EC6F13|nr:alpha/beta fold hydrolase [Kitasatospora sp. MBT63]